MENFLATRLIQGKLKWETLEKSTYSKYCDKTLEVLHSRGYEIDDDKNCIYKG